MSAGKINLLGPGVGSLDRFGDTLYVEQVDYFRATSFSFILIMRKS